MPTEKIAFYQHREYVLDFFRSQNIHMPETLAKELLLFLSKACAYEEESNKIRPCIIIGSNLQTNEFTKITQSNTIQFICEPIDRTHFSKRLKSILPFCNNGWRVFVDILGDSICYGIMRNFNGPSGLGIVDILTTMDDDEKHSLNVNFVLIDITSSFEIQLKSNGAFCKIDFRLEEDDWDNERAKNNFCQDLLSSYSDEDAKPFIAYRKIIELFSHKLHGSICFIIKHGHVLPDALFNDGIFLETPIDIYTVLSDDLSEKNSPLDISFAISSHEKYHALTGVFLEMLNIDGITIVDDKGRIRAFNVFIKSDTDTGTTISGGARKRAANFLINQKNPNYIGVYFQSQDGTNFYERVINE